MGQYRQNLITIAPVEVLVAVWWKLTNEVAPELRGKARTKAMEKVADLRMTKLVRELSFLEPEFLVFLETAAHEWAHFLSRGERQAEAFSRQFEAFIGKAIMTEREKQRKS